MAEDKQVKKYFENMPYGEDSKSSEIHGKHNQLVINNFISSLVRNYDKHMEAGDKQTAGHFNDAVKQMSKQLDNLKSIKEEFAMNYGGGVGGKNMFSNYTDLNFDRTFFTEQGRIEFGENAKPVLIITDQNGEDVVKSIEDVTENWVLKGEEEAKFMEMQQDAVKQSNSVGQSLDFDVDHAVDNLLSTGWKSLATDKVGGRYFLHDYLQENQDKIQSGEITDEMLHPDSFNPDFDTRLHQYYANRLNRSFDPNFQTAREAREADALIARTKPQDNTENNQA